MRRLTALSVLALAFSAFRLPAQSTFATLTGTVTDATGAVVPGVSVTATHLATNLKTTARTNDVGVYTLANLREGEFKIVAQAAGFRDLTVDRISLVARDVRRLDLKLELGDVQQTVEVTASAGLIETDTGRIGDLRTDRELNSLAANAVSRSVWRYFSLSPMFVVPRGSTTPSFAGSRADQWSMSFDGTSISNGMGGTVGGNIMDYSDWVKEVKADFVNNSAEYGQLVQVAMVARSGENDFHGSVFDYYSSPAFRARNPFATSRGTGVKHNPGFSAGGPVVLPKIYNGKNRTFWFVAAESPSGSQAYADLAATVPLDAWRKGDFSALGIPIRNPFTGDVYQDGRIPAQFINPVAKEIQDRFYPLPNYGSTSVLQNLNYRETRSRPFDKQYNAIARLDQRIGDNDYFYVSFMMDQLRVASWEGNLPAFGPRQQLRQQKVVNITHSHTFRPTLLNEFRFGHGADTNNYQGPLSGQEVVGSLGIQGLAGNLPDIGGVYKASFSGIGLQGLSQIDRGLYGPRTQHIQDQVSYFRGRHSLKFGFQIGRAFPTEISAGSCLFGCATFANTYSKVPNVANSGHPYADFLFGVPTSVTRAFAPLTVQRRRWYEEFYAQDDWKVTPRLTLNLGLRYELHPAWHEAGGLMAMFDPASGSIVVPDESLAKISPLMPASYVPVVKASDAGLPASTLLRTDKNNIAPRFGFAWRPFGNRTVFRGAYGLYYDATPAQVDMGGVPFAISEPTYTNTTPVPSVVLPQAFPSAGVAGPPSIGLPSAYNPDLKIPYTQQWNMTVEHERGGFGFRASYVGTTTRQLVYGRDINAPAIDDRLYIQKTRPFPKYPGITYYDNGASHTYHGLSLAVQRRMRGGLQIESSYTYARDVGDAVSSIENPFDRRRERAVEQSIPTHRMVNSFIYELPFGRGRKWLAQSPRAVNAALGGWNLSGITYFQTGQFLTPTVQVPDPTGTRYTTSGNRPLITIRPDALRNANLGDPTLDRWFDTDAFAAPPIGRFGNSSRGVVIGPGVNVWHAALQKYFVFSDNPRVPRVRLDLYAVNVFNHPNWDNPNVNLSSPDLRGRITAAGGVNTGSLGDNAVERTMRMAIRVEW